MNIQKLRQITAALLLFTKILCTSGEFDFKIPDSMMKCLMEKFMNERILEEKNQLAEEKRLMQEKNDPSKYTYTPVRYFTKRRYEAMSYFYLPNQIHEPKDTQREYYELVMRFRTIIYSLYDAKEDPQSSLSTLYNIYDLVSQLDVDLIPRIRYIEALQNFLHIFDSTLLISFKSYYSSCIRDILEYTNKNITQFSQNEATELCPEKKEETIGDIYAQCLKSRNKYSYMMSFDMIDDINKDEKDFLNKAIKQILCIPEVHEDFYMFEIAFIKEVEEFVQSAIGKLKEKSHELSILSKNFAVIWYLYATVHKDSKLLDQLYPHVHALFKQEYGQTSFTAYDVYKKVYGILVYFYEFAPYYTNVVNDGRERLMNISITRGDTHKLSGKNVIVDHCYKKCSIEMDLYTNPLCNNEFICERLSKKSYTEEKNMWEVSPKVQPHYHVQFVDNSKQQLKIVHMPYYLYKNEKTQHKIYLHTISQICAHIERVFDLSKHNNESTRLYPFKRNKVTGVWSYIKPNNSDRKKTIKCLEAENYNVVFYYIEEGLIKDNFVFAHLQLSDECHPKKDSQNNPLHRIPLFFSPLMLSAIPIYPYKYKCNGSPTKAFDYSKLVPNEYIYGEDIRQMKASFSKDIRDWTYNKNYHADFFIRESDAEYEDSGCYVMNAAQREILTDQKSAEITWYVRTPKNACEYMTFVFDKNKVCPHKDAETGEYATDNLIRMLQRKHQSVDVGRFGFCLYYDDASPDEPRVAKVLCPFMKTRLEEPVNSDIKIPSFVHMVTVKDVDGSMSKFGLHSDILSALMDRGSLSSKTIEEVNSFFKSNIKGTSY